MKTAKRARRILFALIVTGILFSMPLQAYAKKSKTAKKALKAYKQMLSQEKIYIVPANTLFEGITWRYDKGDSWKAALKRSLGDTFRTHYEYDEDDNEYYEEGGNLKYSRQSDIEFAVAYIDNNNVPELIIRRPEKKGCACAYVYTYRKGKVVKVKYPFSKMEFGRDGSITEITGYYKKKGVFIFNVELDDQRYYLRLKSGKAKMIAWNTGGYTEEPNYPKTKAKYKSVLRRYTGGRKKTKIKWHANTPANRKKYLK